MPTLVVFFFLLEFPSLQRVLLDSELPSLVVKMSSCDGESFVRGTAIKCLQKMIQVEDIFRNVLESEDLWVSRHKMESCFIDETNNFCFYRKRCGKFW